jgi:hypothetical protein
MAIRHLATYFYNQSKPQHAKDLDHIVQRRPSLKTERTIKGHAVELSSSCDFNNATGPKHRGVNRTANASQIVCFERRIEHSFDVP